MRKLVFAAGAAIGYVLGTKAGRQRYEQISGAARQVAAQPTVKQAINEVQSQATRVYDAAKTAVNQKIGSTRLTNGTPTADPTKRLPADDQSTVPAPLP